MRVYIHTYMWNGKHTHYPTHTVTDGWETRKTEWVGLNKSGWKKRKREAEAACDSLWERFKRAELAGTAFRDATIDKWNSKVLMAAGGGKSFKALNQSILQQAAQVMQDMPRSVPCHVWCLCIGFVWFCGCFVRMRHALCVGCAWVSTRLCVLNDCDFRYDKSVTVTSYVRRAWLWLHMWEGRDCDFICEKGVTVTSYNNFY